MKIKTPTVTTRAAMIVMTLRVERARRRCLTRRKGWAGEKEQTRRRRKMGRRKCQQEDKDPARSGQGSRASSAWTSASPTPPASSGRGQGRAKVAAGARTGSGNPRTALGSALLWKVRVRSFSSGLLFVVERIRIPI